MEYSATGTIRQTGLGLLCSRLGSRTQNSRVPFAHKKVLHTIITTNRAEKNQHWGQVVYSLSRDQFTYNMARSGGALVFKGEGGGDGAKGKSKKKSKRKTTTTGDNNNSDAAAVVVAAAAAVVESEQGASTAAAAATAASHPKQNTAAAASTAVKRGSGKITTSGTVVTGHETRFMKEIGVGDAILVDINDIKNGQQQQQEMRVVTMRLSDVSLNLSSAFTQNVATPAQFFYIPKPRDAAKEAATARERAVAAAAEEGRHHYAAGNGTGELVYRERTEHGNYRTKRVKLDDGMSARNRSDLLELRAKKTSDKYC